jgi:hypothetical protein
MASFITGALGGYSDTALKLKKEGKHGLLRRKKKTGQQGSGETPYEGKIPEFKRGGKVKRTGLARLHKGEKVLTKKQAKRHRSKRSASKSR